MLFAQRPSPWPIGFPALRLGRKKTPLPGRLLPLVRTTGLEPARSEPIDPKSYISLSLIWKTKDYSIGTGRKRAYLFLAQSTRKNANNLHTLAFADGLRAKADNYGRHCFRVSQPMVLHQSEPLSFLAKLKQAEIRFKKEILLNLSKLFGCSDRVLSRSI